MTHMPMRAKISALRRFGACLLLAAASVAATAQTNSQGPGASADELLRASQQTLRQIDEGLGADLWRASAPFIRVSFSEPDYVNAILQARKRVAAVRERNWTHIARIGQSGDSPGVPAGVYASIDFSTSTGSGNVLYERLSFRLEADGWHPVGYDVRDKP
ncbi:DUF4019 domain-containing protein [Variovorax sp. 770b2]|jgi:hypothetical protein|uniref:DUF4019 domain-containing protein n=1 Tax=Variovorax sp. 770b2 TaxID=1566271 RepID=UPI0008E275A1|nr:DUF4019 domain-containing protein [Variovorax sp. 770b2]SFQ37061.1 Protein of unknown function [Variovorax sp. 770b2]